MSLKQTLSTNLPRPLTRFVGRDDEINTLMEMLCRDDVQLITLTGPGGIGKTRLSVEIARRFADSGEQNVYFVSLATVPSVEDAMSTIAETLGVWDTQKGNLVQRSVQILGDGPALLVLDNLEHVVEIAADIAELLFACPNLTILGTSRIPLHIQGEREYSVPQLTLVDTEAMPGLRELMQHESIALFVDRAGAINQGFTLTEENAPVVVEICARLEGIPLAIELAAARTKALPPAALLRRLDNQLRILRSDSRDLPNRLQTMRATINWSYELLEPDEREAFRYLSIFVGDFSLNAAAAVLQIDDDEAVDTVASLIDKSLLVRRDSFNEQPHYRILAVVREFGLEQLEASDERDIARQRQAEYLAGLLEHLYPDQFNQNQATVFNLLDRKHENIRQTLAWLVETEQWELAARIAGRLWQYWDVRGYLAEGSRWLNLLISQEFDYPASLLPDLYYGCAILVGSREEAVQNEALAEKLSKVSDATGDRRVLATVNNLRGLSADPEVSLQGSVAACELWLALGETVPAGMSAALACRWARESGQMDLADEYAQISYDILKDTGHYWGLALALLGIGRALQLRGQLEQATVRLKEGLELVQKVGDRIAVLRFLEYLFEIAAAWSQNELAIKLAAASTRMREIIGYGLRYPAEQAAFERTLAEIREKLGEELSEVLWDEGRRLNVEQAIKVAHSLEPGNKAKHEEIGGSLFHLTNRERDVLRLIVEGKTDQAIADELFISYRTVTTHVTNLLNKLGANSRTEAAAIAIRKNLTGE
jgi:predicted ATPase/DNA-binding CsgD family transcriptional regulator